jgi:hypothetical protein
LPAKSLRAISLFSPTKPKKFGAFDLLFMIRL